MRCCLAGVAFIALIVGVGIHDNIVRWVALALVLDTRFVVRREDLHG